MFDVRWTSNNTGRFNKKLDTIPATVYPKKYAHGCVVLCFVVVMQSFIMNSHEVFIHIHHGCFSGTGAIVRLPQCQWSKPDGYGKISQCITTTKHSKAKTVCIFLGIYCKSCDTSNGWYAGIASHGIFGHSTSGGEVIRKQKWWKYCDIARNLCRIDRWEHWAPTQYKDRLYRYGDSCIKDKTVMRPPYQQHGNTYTGKTPFIYLDGLLVV